MGTASRSGSPGAAVAWLAVAGGAVYAVLSLVIGVGAIAWLIILVVLSRRFSLRALSLPAVGFLVGYAIAFVGLLVPNNLACQAPSCVTVPWNVDLTWGVFDLVIAAAVVGIVRSVMLLARSARPRL